MSSALGLWPSIMLFIYSIWHCQTNESLLVFPTSSLDRLLCKSISWCTENVNLSQENVMKRDRRWKLRYCFVTTRLTGLSKLNCSYSNLSKCLMAPYTCKRYYRNHAYEYFWYKKLTNEFVVKLSRHRLTISFERFINSYPLFISIWQNN